MKYLHRFILFLTFLVCTSNVQCDIAKDEKRFVFVIASYNNRDWYQYNLDSVFFQSYPNFRVIYVDDCSPDGTGELVHNYIRKKGWEDRVTLIRNKERVGALANIYNAIHMCGSNEIVVNLDGDDWLAHRKVLEELTHVYENPNVWLTYGQFVYWPSYERGIGEEIPRDVIEKNEFRSFTRGTTALRTFYAGLFHRIKKEDLLDNGAFFKVGYDLAMMFPMLEMAGRHIQFVPEVSYVYNYNTPINDAKIYFEEQAATDRYLRTKEKYQPISHFNQNGKTKKVYITPGYWGELFSVDNPYLNRDNCLDVMYRLRDVAAANGYALAQADSLDALDEFEYLIVYDVFPEQIQQLMKYPKEKLVLFLWEPPSVIPDNYDFKYHQHFSKVYTWNDALVDNKKYFKFYYPVYRTMITDPVDFLWKRFSTLIACNKESSFPTELYSERWKLINFFETQEYDAFDLFGKGWPNYLITYQGPIVRKVDILKHYKFCFAYENVKGIPGYVTEKIFDSLQAGCVPVYWGAPNIGEYVPKGCFIHREDFSSNEALYHYLRNMKRAEYENYVRNIAQFLESDAARRFSIENFIDTFMHLITEG